MSIKATPDARTGTITLEISDTRGVTGILRADTNGTRPVRLRAGELPAAGPATVTDYEPALSGLVQYRLEGGDGDTWTQFDGVEVPRFVLPSIPLYSVPVQAVTAYTAERVSTAKLHYPINRADPIVAQGRLSPRTGRLEIWCEAYADARDLENMLERGQVTMFRQVENPGQDMYFHAQSWALEPDEDTWKATVSYVEVAFPAGAVQSARGWTFARLRTAAESFDALPGVFDTFHDVTIGERS